ncbi:MAG: acetoacetate decarboxylase family protein [Anaerolineae bacterium]|nr:acetoacetate decarboxylase family protein [Candidatus Roseilinea sp.]MDW8451778.1 acetoacetate decarboxylase family protein [Anaerolineae bacterium]
MIAPPPWQLTGDGFIWLFRFSRTFIERCGFMAEWQRAHLEHALGAMMLVDYRETNVGPYRELLFMPGRFDLGRTRTFSISKIYVSTEASVRGGIENWGIPKELASFARERRGDGSEAFSAALDGQVFFSAELMPFGPRFPISSSLVPLTVAQASHDDLLVTRSTAKGSARLCRVREMRVDGARFPDVARIKPIAVIAVNDFHMTFPVPEVVRGYFAKRRE